MATFFSVNFSFVNVHNNNSNIKSNSNNANKSYSVQCATNHTLADHINSVVNSTSQLYLSLVSMM